MPDCALPLDDADAASPFDAAGTPRRGPFRPEVWLNARQRSGVRLAPHAFRAVDVLAVVATAAVALSHGRSDRIADLAPVILGVVVFITTTPSLGGYRFGRTGGVLVHLGPLLMGWFLAAGSALAVATLLGRGMEAAQIWAWSGALILCLLHGLWTVMVLRWSHQGVLRPNVVVVGATRYAEALILSAIERRDINVLGVFDDRLARSPDSLAGVPVLGDAEALIAHRITPYVDHIVLAIDPQAGVRARELTRRLETLPNPVTVLVDDSGRDAALDRLARAPLASLTQAGNDARRAFAKRMLDLILGVPALLLAAPVMALIALAIRLDSRGPVFFRQRRHGFNQEEIVVWKFRSMRQEAADATASRQVTAGDDRVTRVGRFIRATSLDELPQIFNVLSGEMSLVGPRPHAIGMKTGDTESARLVADYAHRHRIKPGMTGWAAIQGSRGPLHSEADVRRRVQLDIDYVERHSVWLDLWILLVTVPVLLGDRAAVR
ncbi:exopolysaccharide biosynthesis polyprenyl glycosylphosphotransferase [Brevundimonas sp. PAMC22021]|uniref:exopolysaccharide biosynthesis polyprenyl glycosylphosphotransferase n=1 Tax=Brevundimonas sp. PAMC22021 TaxID=2861285 RepID=UPI001C631F08|nr:exopolysaccharide biosynthesis polyprenyl glycosylphosphotransferase [Brevundimonas sp. PAMC22021]QYF88151.1 exopolysaccharide biosynthesis polyprenyl glycosylphosphotransferase [Brevundimonas sp. PAMC22021]